MNPPKPIKRLYAVTNTYSGVVGEMAVATALIRAGFQVAKPYWNDDEMDLIVFWVDTPDFIPIPIQVKSMQLLGDPGPEKTTQGLKKKYVERQPSLCLAIYSPESNKLWFIPGASTIKQLHAQGVQKGKGKAGRPRTPYDQLTDDDDVNIYVNLKGGDPDFDRDWLIDTESPMKLTSDIRNLAKGFKTQTQRRHLLEAMFPAAQPVQTDPAVVSVPPGCLLRVGPIGEIMEAPDLRETPIVNKQAGNKPKKASLKSGKNGK